MKTIKQFVEREKSLIDPKAPYPWNEMLSPIIMNFTNDTDVDINVLFQTSMGDVFDHNSGQEISPWITLGSGGAKDKWRWTVQCDTTVMITTRQQTGNHNVRHGASFRFAFNNIVWYPWHLDQESTTSTYKVAWDDRFHPDRDMLPGQEYHTSSFHAIDIKDITWSSVPEIDFFVVKHW